MRIGKKTHKKLLASDRLLKTLHDLVLEPKLAGKYYKPIYIRMSEVRKSLKKDISADYYTIEGSVSRPEEINIHIAIELCAIVKSFVGKDGKPKIDKFDADKGKYENYVTMQLRNAIVNEVDKDKTNNKDLVYDGGTIDAPVEIRDDSKIDGFNSVKYNRRPKDKVSPKIIIIEELVSNNVPSDSIVNSFEIIDIFKEFYGEDIIDNLLEGLQYNINYTMKEAIFAAGKGNEYEKLKKRFYRNSNKFIELLKSRGVKITKTKYGEYLKYE